MDIVARAKNIIVNPKVEWEVIKAEPWTVRELFIKYAVILALIPAVASFIGFSFVGVSYFGGTFTYPIGTGITYMIVQFLFGLLGVWVLGFVIDALAPSFGSVKNLDQSMKVVAFAYTPSWIAGIFYLFPVLFYFASIAAIYSLVLLYMGLKTIKDVPQDKMVGYFVVTLIIAVVIFILVKVIVSGVAFSGYSAGTLY